MPATITTKFIFRQALVAGVLLSTASIASPSSANSDIYIRGGGGDYTVKTKTFLERRYVKVVRQKYDFSCGSAALATLLTYHYDHPISEIEALESMIQHGDAEKIKREGFSLLDMKQYLNAIGYEAEGFRESLDKLAKVKIPAIVLINKKNYLHFVVIKGVDKNRVSVGDPTLGLVFYDRKEFESMWNGILFVITNNMQVAKKNFNSDDSWKPYGITQFRNALTTGQLGAVALNTVYSPGYY
ncbi:MAG: C39 family peptidase [Alphaproteobacteria bacterium]